MNFSKNPGKLRLSIYEAAAPRKLIHTCASMLIGYGLFSLVSLKQS